MKNKISSFLENINLKYIGNNELNTEEDLFNVLVSTSLFESFKLINNNFYENLKVSNNINNTAIFEIEKCVNIGNNLEKNNEIDDNCTLLFKCKKNINTNFNIFLIQKNMYLWNLKDTKCFENSKIIIKFSNKEVINNDIYILFNPKDIAIVDDNFSLSRFYDKYNKFNLKSCLNTFDNKFNIL